MSYTKRSPEEIREELNLIEKYRSTGDLNVLGELYNKYMHLVYGLCLKYLKNREDSQDAVMQIFEKIMESLKTHEVSNFKSWLYVVSKNFCLMKIRSQSYQKEKTQKDIADLHMESSFVMHPNNEPTLEDNLTLLEHCIEKLQSEQKVCVELFYLQKKSYTEIATTTNYELKKVKSYIQNGKRNLKICMEKNSEKE